MREQLVIFDLDGTILDTLEDLYLSVNHALRKNALPERTMEEVRCFVGNGIRKLIERAVPEGSVEALIDQVHADFTEYYEVHCADHTKPYEGIPELIRSLRAAGLKTAVVSNKADYAVQSLCSQYFPGLFDAVTGEREGVRRKPAPDSVNFVLNQLKVKCEQSVYIGDSDVDILTAKNASMPCRSVDWGFRSAAFLIRHGAGQIFSKPDEVAEYLLKK